MRVTLTWHVTYERGTNAMKNSWETKATPLEMKRYVVRYSVAAYHEFVKICRKIQNKFSQMSIIF